MPCGDLGGWDGWGEGDLSGGMCMHMADSLPSMAETNNSVKQPYPNRLK